MKKIIEKIKISGGRSFLITLLVCVAVVFLLYLIAVLISFDENSRTSSNTALLKIFIFTISSFSCVIITFGLHVLSEKIKIDFKSFTSTVKKMLFNEYKNLVILVPLLFSIPSFIMLIYLCSKVDTNYYLYTIYIIFTHFILCVVGMDFLHFRRLSEKILQIKKQEKPISNSLLSKLRQGFSSFIYFLFFQLKAYFRFCVLLLLVVMFFLYCFYNRLANDLSSGWSEYFFATLIMIILMYIIIYLFSIRKHPPLKHQLEKMPIKGFNIDIDTLKNEPIYVMEISKESNPYLFEVNVDSLFGENAVDRNLHIEGAYQPSYIDNANNGEIKVNDKILLLCDINESEKHNIIRLKIHLSYKNQNYQNRKCSSFLKKRNYEYKYYEILLGFTIYSTLLIPSEKYQVEFKKHSFKRKSINQKIAMLNKGEVDDKYLFRKLILNSISKIYYFNDLSNTIDLNKKVLDNRKVLLHDSSFGMGKTTYDVMSIVNQEKIPIVVSPWESNFDHDILYLIFDSVRTETSTKKFSTFRDGIMFFYLIVTAIYPFFVDHFTTVFTNTVEIVSEAFVMFFNLEKFEIYRIISRKFDEIISALHRVMPFIIGIVMYFVIILIARWIFKKIIPSLIIFKKDYTKIYKTFFIDSIMEMLSKNPNYILLVEDVDRLENNAQNETFRILSSINTLLPKYSELFCLLSYDTKEADSPNKIDYKVINNKIIYRKWGEKYEKEQSMKKYISFIFNMIALLYEHNEGYSVQINKLEEEVKNSGDESGINFRDIHSILQAILNDLDEKGTLDLSVDEMKNIMDIHIDKYIASN
ncbi:hypothetical protein M2475_000829 [Breznakia sp. PF5-3]|uniref:hypothetical protein n=1 Tax=unclassified Breznakia TaxID=2623764 RepID=UPI00240528CA|nr:MULTISPECIES: hypothetical protein [unclassified Breznakia]MDF9824453.1 hypothetical protein [Breznakia sp. PM6-1]MDF9835264.1 hypothetical protein [Breznakia sp. PF5-3]MDF9837408.1 hypothetical protein [Breznakia sp. PFB2-8]MDF9859343.1 hypothetical protein [Breznakia sp. PH5-24]